MFKKSILFTISFLISGLSLSHDQGLTFSRTGLLSWEKSKISEASFIGFESTKNGDSSVTVKLFSLEDSALQTHRYVCDDLGSCTFDSLLEPKQYSTKAAVFSKEEFEHALEGSLHLFEEIATIDQIKTLKVWRSFDAFSKESTVEFKYVWGEANRSTFMFCHEHEHDHAHENSKHEDEHEIDCHVKRRVGPNEP